MTPDGVVTPWAIYPRFPNPNDGGATTVDSVPTGMAWGPDGALYVGFETGGPFPVGGSSVVRLSDNNGDGDALDAGEMTTVADGLTTVTAIAFDHDGSLLVLEFRGFLVHEDATSGRVVCVRDGAMEVVASGLVTPTGLAVGPDGALYVAQEYIGVIARISQ